MTVPIDSAVRRNDIDALRVFATFVLFVFHTTMIFNPAPFYHIRNDEVSIVFLIASGFVSLWHMPLFFFLAGWSLYRSLESRGGKGVVRERLTRIGIPLMVGTALFGPGIKYLELTSGFDMNYAGLRIRADLQDSFKEVMPPFDESFAEFVPTFFTHLDRFTWSHLWFLAYLLTFTIAYLPLLRRWADGEHRRTTPRRWWVYAPIVLLALVQVFLRPHWPGIQNLYNDWANFALYSTYLFVGFGFARAPEVEQLAHQERNHAAVSGLLACLVLLLAVFGVITSPTVVLAGTAVAGWCFVLALLGLANVRVKNRSASLNYLSEAAYPVYILHQPAIVFIGYPVLALGLGSATKFLLITTLAIAATRIVYHFAVRRSAVLRLLTGMPSAPSRKGARLSTRVAVATLILCLAVVTTTAAQTPPPPLGLWWAEGGSAKVRIMPCGEQLCGGVEWLHAPLGRNGCPLTDEHNPTKQLRDRPVLGLRIVDDNTLELRGYIGIPLIGRSAAWHRVSTQ